MSLDTYDEMPEQSVPEAGDGLRPYVCIMFDCCNIYVRVYRKPSDNVYRGRCPKCLRTVQLRVGPDGTPTRFFHAE